MLETINLDAKLSKKEYEEQYDKLRPRLGELQRQLQEKGIPLMILTEGWHGSQKGLILNQFLLTIDPRSYRYLSFDQLLKAYGKRSPLVPFWRHIPAFGQIGILETDWFRYAYQYRFGQPKVQMDLRALYRDVNSFERQLVQSGMIILKFFFHIDKKTQKKRLEARQNNKELAWTITEDKWNEQEEYENYFSSAEEFIQNTQTPYSSWHIIAGNNFEFAASKTLHIIGNAIESYLKSPPVFNRPVPYYETDIVQSGAFGNIDYSPTIDADHYGKKLKTLQTLLLDQLAGLVRYNIPVVVVFEGVDAAGKGGGFGVLHRRFIRWTITLCL